MTPRQAKVTAHSLGEALGLMLAFPALVAVSLLLAAAGATNALVVVVALLAWFVGPVLLVVGGAMLWRRIAWTVLPSTETGRWSLRLIVAFAASFAVFIVALGLELGPDTSERFFSNLFLAIPALAAAGFAISAALIAGYAMVFLRERSVLALGTLAFGILVAIFAGGEIGGHDEPGSRNPDAPRSSGSAPVVEPTHGLATETPASATATITPPRMNGHWLISIVGPEAGEVVITFRYEYGYDPPGKKIEAITVTPLDHDLVALPDSQPFVRQVSPGSGQIDAGFSFSSEQLAQLRAFSICFTGPYEPDLGCTVANYSAR